MLMLNFSKIIDYWEDLWITPKEVLEYGFMGLMLFIDGLVYKLISSLFTLFEALAGVQMLSNEMYESIANRIYLFVGIIALFVITVSLLKSLVNPDETNKQVVKSFKSLVTSLILIILLPSIFKYAYSFQTAIIQDNIIGKIFHFDLVEKNTDSTSMTDMCNFTKDKEKDITNLSEGEVEISNIQISRMQCHANYAVMTVLEAFLRPESGDGTTTMPNSIFSDALSNVGIDLQGTTWNDAKEYMIYTGNFTYITSFIKSVVDPGESDGMAYLVIISTAAGLYCAYVILSFCIDLGIRTFKLAFYQLIAPIPILYRIIPGKEDVFNKWSKQVISCFLEVFVRLLIIEFIFFILSNALTILDSLEGFGNVGFLGKAILVLGLFSFAKQAPKLLKDALSLDGDGVKIRIKGKLEDNLAGKVINTGVTKATGAATGAIGGAWTSAMNKGDIKLGAKLGALNGMKSGGNQFNSQRQSTYSTLGLSGKAGFWGGRSYLDEQTSKVKDKYSDEYKDRVIRQWVDNYESSDKWNELFNKQLNALRIEHEQNKANLEKMRDESIDKMKSEIEKINEGADKLISDLKSNAFRDQIMNPNAVTNTSQVGVSQIDDNVQQKIAEIERKRQGDITSITNKYDQINRQLNSEIEKETEKLNGQTEIRKRLNSDGKVIKENINAIELEAYKLVQQEMRDLDVVYADKQKEYAKRLSEREVKDYLTSPEGLKDIAAREKATENYYKNHPNKDEKK